MDIGCFLCRVNGKVDTVAPVIDRAQLLSILSEMPDPAYIIGRDMAVTYVNPAAGHVFPVNAGERCYEGLAGRSSVCPGCAVISCLETGSARRSRAELLTADGSFHHFETSATPFSADECIVLARDVTAITSAETGRREMLSMLSHDIRTPLTVIRLNAEMLLASSEAARDDGLKSAIESISRAAHSMSSLLDDFMTISRLESGCMELDLRTVPLSSLVGSALGQVRRLVEECAAEVAVEIPDDLPHVAVDLNRFERVITNVVANALKHCQKGVRLCVGARREGGFAVVDFSDDGPGIPCEDLPHILDRGRSRVRVNRGEGHGLGLMIVKTIMDMHGGGVEIECGEEGGTTVRLRIPTAPSTH